MPEFMEDREGVHVHNPEDEGMLCGLYDSEHNDLRKTRKTTVTCRVCARMLHEFRQIKYNLHEDDKDE